MTAFDHSDRAPYLRGYATTIVATIDDEGQVHPDTHRLVCWVYYSHGDDPVGQITPKGAGQGFDVSLADGTKVDGEYRTRRTAERALRFAVAGIPDPEAVQS